MATYQRLQAKALELIGKYGAPATIRRHTRTDYDPETGNFGDDNYTDHNIYAVNQPAAKQTQTGAGQKFMDGVLIEAGDRIFIVPAINLEITPAPGDILISGQETFTVKAVNTVKPATLALIHTILAKK